MHESKGGNISDQESPAKALALDFEYLADLFRLLADESRFRAFWSPRGAWIFYAKDGGSESLGRGKTGPWSNSLETFKPKESFYGEILKDAREQELV